MDGAVLSAPLESGDETRGAATTEILAAPTSASHPPPLAQSTIVATPPPLPAWHSAAPPIAAPAKSTKTPWIIAAVAVVFAGALAVAFIVMALLNSSATTGQKSDSRDRQPPNRESPEVRLACSHSVSPALYRKWSETGGETGKLGCPSTDETEAPASPLGSTGRWIQFAKDDGAYLIEYTRPEFATGAVKPAPLVGQVFEVSGCMFKLYSSLGGTKSWLGFPVSDGRDTTTGVQQDFEAGYVVWDRKTYRCEAKKP